MKRLTIVFAACLLAAAWGLEPAVSRDKPGASVQARWAKARTWLYWLQEVDPSAVASSGFDVVVTDPSRDGSRKGEWSKAEVKKLAMGGRVTLAYLSVGEAEDYRAYWKSAWKNKPPPWLGKENADWKGNYAVRFWLPGWRAVVLGKDGPLERALRAGFDGVYLDKIDAYEEWGPTLPEAKAAPAMAAFVRAIAKRARQIKPGALIVLQNGAAIATRPDVLSRVDGLALEDTWFDGDGPQDADHTREVLGHARRVRQAKKPVLAIDYCRDFRLVRTFYRRARAAGLVPYSSVRDLDRLVSSPR